jgi:hypothetical protein
MFGAVDNKEEPWWLAVALLVQVRPVGVGEVDGWVSSSGLYKPPKSALPAESADQPRQSAAAEEAGQRQVVGGCFRDPRQVTDHFGRVDVLVDVEVFRPCCEGALVGVQGEVVRRFQPWPVATGRVR